MTRTTGNSLNTLTASELKRRGVAALEEGLRYGPVRIIKRNRPTVVVLAEADYQRLTSKRGSATPNGMTALQWLLAQPSRNRRSKSKAQIDAQLKAERAW